MVDRGCKQQTTNDKHVSVSVLGNFAFSRGGKNLCYSQVSTACKNSTSVILLCVKTSIAHIHTSIRQPEIAKIKFLAN